MDLKTIHSKTAKGVTQVTSKSASLSRDLMKVLKMVDGKSNLEQLSKAADLPVPVMEKALQSLLKDGFIRVFEVRRDDEGFSSFGDEEGDDFDFTKPTKPAPKAPGAPAAPSRDDAAALAAAREKAQTEARARAEREAQIRARLEVEAMAKAEAEKRAVEEARRMKEAAERAKRELESKLAEEAARKKALSDSHIKLTLEQARKEEEEQKALAALRVKAENEAKALAEARAKAEAEAAALAAARVQAEAAARRQAEEAAIAQRDLRAQLKEEIEARIRQEMEAKLRVEIEDSAREELEQAVMEDAREEARAELERRLKEETASLRRAEVEATNKAQVEAKRMLAEQEQRLRAEMEQRIKAETESLQRVALEARARAEREAIERQELEDRLRKEAEARKRAEQESELRQEAEARNRLRLEARAREEAEERARVEADMKARLEAEQRAKYEAEARLRLESEDRQRREAETGAQLEAARRQAEEAERKARMEAEAREAAMRAAADVDARVDTERKAREKAEAKARKHEEEEERERQEQVARLKHLQEQADERARREQQQLEGGGASRVQKVRYKKPTPWGTYIVVSLILIVGGGIGLLHVIPMGALQGKIQRGLSAWMHDDVSISGVHFALFPSPRLKLSGLTVGKAFDAKASSGVIKIPLGALFDENVNIDTLELTGITLSQESTARIPLWGKNTDRPKNVSINRIVLRGVKLDIKDVTIPEFHVTMSLDKGNLRTAHLTAADTRWSLDLRPEGEGFAVEAALKGTPLPLGASIPLDDIRATGTLVGTQLIFPELSGTAYNGSFTGSVRADWASGINVATELALKDMNLTPLFETFTKDIQINGKMEGAFSINLNVTKLADLMKAPNIQGSYSVRDGSISNVDLVQVMRTEGAGRGGSTKFQELTGGLAISGGEVRYTKLKLQGGVILAGGEIAVLPNEQLNGRINVELRSSVAQDRGSFAISGTVAKPTVRRGG
jgi:hypothetical protein